MTLKEFETHLYNLQCTDDLLVNLRYKYECETEWTYSKELLLYNVMAVGIYEWNNDWWEGQENVEILGYIPISKIFIPSFDKGGEE